MAEMCALPTCYMLKMPLTTEENYPYNASDATCAYSLDLETTDDVQLYSQTPVPNDEESLLLWSELTQKWRCNPPGHVAVVRADPTVAL
eukprot:gene23292-30528_t